MKNQRVIYIFKGPVTAFTIMILLAGNIALSIKVYQLKQDSCYKVTRCRDRPEQVLFIHDRH